MRRRRDEVRGGEDRLGAVVKLKPHEVEGFIARPPAAVAVALLYGPDEGLVRERALRLQQKVVADPDDPFRTVVLDEGVLLLDPARLADEFGSVSMLGGRRVVRLRILGERSLSPLVDFVRAVDAETIKGDALVIFEAGDLKASSPLRNAVESGRRAMALPNYADDPRGLKAVILGTLQAANLAIDEEALGLLIARLGGDRGTTRAELEKLILYMTADAAAGSRTVCAADLMEAVSAANDLGLEDVAYAAASGNFARLDEALERCFYAAEPPVAVLRATARHVEHLALAGALLAEGMAPASIVAAFKPPIHFRRHDEFKSQVGRWTIPACRRALNGLYAAEIACKTTGLPAELMCRRALLALAQDAGR